MSKAFENASAVYLVIPQRLDRDDFRAYQERTSDAYAAQVFLMSSGSVASAPSMRTKPDRSLGLLPGSRRLDLPLPWIATKDVGEYAAKRLGDRDFSSSSTQELLGPRDMSMKEAATIVGQAIGKPGLGYMQMPFTALESALMQMGLPKSSVALLIEIGKAENDALLTPQELRSARNSASTTLEWFATEVFAAAYLGSAATA